MNIPYRSRLLALIFLSAAVFFTGCTQQWIPGGVPPPQGSGKALPTFTPVLSISTLGPGISDTGEKAATPAAATLLPSATVGSKVDAACLVGIWEVQELSQAMAGSYAQSGSSLQLQGVEGAAFYQFTVDGLMKITFDQIQATFSGSLDGRPVTVRQSIDGSATASYRIDVVEEQLILSDFGDSGILFSLAINQQVLVEGNLPIWQAFTSTIPGEEGAQPLPPVHFARTSMDCQGDHLRIRAVAPVPGPVIVLRRVQ